VEALTRMLENEGILVKRAGIGPINKKDLQEAEAVRGENPYLGLVLAFNVKSLEGIRDDAASMGLPIISSTIIYSLIDEYKKWKVEEERREREEAHKRLVMPAKLKVLSGCMFRASKPCIVGVEVLVGTLRTKASLLGESGERIGEVRDIQNEGKSLPEATAGMRVAVAITGASFEKDMDFNDILLTLVPKEHIAEWREKYPTILNEQEMALLGEIEERRRG